MADPMLAHRASRAWIAYLRAQEKNETLDRENEVLQTQNEELKHENLRVRWQLQSLARIPEEERVEVCLGRLHSRRDVERPRPRARNRGLSLRKGWRCVRKSLRVPTKKLKVEAEKLAEQVGDLSDGLVAFHVKMAWGPWKAERKAREKRFEHWMGDV